MLANFLFLVLVAQGIASIAALRGLTTSSPEIFSCDVVISHMLHVEGDKIDETAYSDEDIACLVDDMVYGIPEKVVKKYQKQLRKLGHKKMYIKGGRLPPQSRSLDFGGSSGEIVVPNATSVFFVDQGGHRKLAGTGTQRKQGTSEVLVIRVIANDASTTLSTQQLSDRIFGDGSNLVNALDPAVPSGTLTKTYQDCSWGKMNFIPATGYDIVSGVGSVTINMNVTGASNRDVENAITKAINGKYGSVNDWDHIIYCHPSGTLAAGKGWLAYGYNDLYRSNYNDLWCGQNSVLVHEIGHNIGLSYVTTR
jgi:hypothetical protein